VSADANATDGQRAGACVCVHHCTSASGGNIATNDRDDNHARRRRRRYRGTVVRVDAAAVLWSSGPGECRRITCTGVCARDVLGAAESTTRYAHTHTRRPCIDVPTATDGDRVMDEREIVSEL